MVVLDYTLAPPEDDDAAVDLAQADETTLRYRCFAGDIVLRVDDADFSTQWGWVPVLDFAAALNFIIEALDDEPEELFEFTESEATIRFVRDGDDVDITASYVEGTAKVPYAELATATASFLGRVIEELTRAHPQLAENEFVAELASDAS